MLIDEVVIRVLSGAGGNGCKSFRREKYIPFGGPNGGNGGQGGSVYLKATNNKTSLLDFKYKPKFEAERGEHGQGNDCFGRGAEDMIISVPAGTQVFDAETGELLIDLINDGDSILIAKGGRGGRGNLAFKTSTNRAPKTAEKGHPGESRTLKLELKLIADIGLVGLPNAGKSSFLRSVSRATPKVADYPFTTLEPHLGVVDHKFQSYVIADLPGLIEGASDGAGLGTKFLKHVSRNRALLHLVDVNETPAKIEKNIQTIQNEMNSYDETLSDRPTFLVFTKCDLLTDAALERKKEALKKRGLTGYFISSHTHYGVEALLNTLSIEAQTWVKEEIAAEQADAEIELAESVVSPEVESGMTA